MPGAASARHPAGMRELDHAMSLPRQAMADALVLLRRTPIDWLPPPARAHDDRWQVHIDCGARALQIACVIGPPVVGEGLTWRALEWASPQDRRGAGRPPVPAFVGRLELRHTASTAPVLSAGGQYVLGDRHPPDPVAELIRRGLAETALASFVTSVATRLAGPLKSIGPDAA